MNEDRCEYEYPGTPLPIPGIEEPRARNGRQIGQNDQEPSKSPFWKRLAFWNVLFNFILAITTTILGFIAYWQLNATNRAINISESANAISTESLRVSQESYRISEESMRISGESSNIAINNFHLDQRAWIGFKGARLISFDSGKPLKVAVSFANTGKTPALKSRIEAMSIVGHKSMDIGRFNFDKARRGLKAEPSTAIIFPGGTKSVETATHTDMNEHIFADLKTGNSVAYIIAKATYSDVFGIQHISWACVRYEPTDSTFNHCDKYNKAD